MKRIIIVNNGTLPLPAVKGGAVETLIDLLIEENEKFGLCHFDVYSIYNKDAIKKSEQYSNSSFHFVKIDGEWIKIKRFIRRVLNALYNRTIGYYHSFPFHRQIVLDVRKSPYEYSAILLEGSRLDAYYLKKETGLPIIQRIHNVPPRPLAKFDRQSASATDLYLGISQFICNVLKCEEGKFCKNIELLYNSIPFYKFQKPMLDSEKSSLRSELGFDRDDFIIMFSGRLREFKGVKELLLAIEKCKSYPSIKLLIVGSHIFSGNEKTPFISSLESIIQRLSGKVHFTGYVNYDDMYRYYHIANICCFPSTWEEPFALTCLEGIVNGKPVVITNSGGMPEIIDNECAVIVPNDSDIPNHLAKEFIRLSQNRRLVEKMGLAAKKRAELFSPDKQYLQFVELINKYMK